MHAHYILPFVLQLRPNSKRLRRNRYLRGSLRGRQGMRRERISECLRGQGDDLHAIDLRATG